MTNTMVHLGELITPAALRRAGRTSFPILSMTMHDGLVDQDRKFKKRIASSDTSQYKIVSEDQLVVGFPIDEGVLSIQDLYPDAIVSPAYSVWDIHGRLSPPYLERYLRSPAALSFYKAKLRGTTARRRTLPNDVFLTLPVPVPRLEEQRRIVDILDRAEAIRAKRREALAHLDDLTQSIFLDMFGDPKFNPRGWTQITIGEIGDVITGNTPPRSNPENFGDGVEWIKSDNIGKGAVYLTTAEERLSPAGRRLARVVGPGAVLVTCIAGSPNSIGNVSMADREVAFNQQINAIVPKAMNSTFLYVQLLVGKRLVQDMSTGGMKGLVSKSQLGKVRLLVPPSRMQEEFASCFSRINILREHSKAQAAGADSLFASVQQRAFIGAL